MERYNRETKARFDNLDKGNNALKEKIENIKGETNSKI
jgi:hypothetical protein